MKIFIIYLKCHFCNMLISDLLKNYSLYQKRNRVSEIQKSEAAIRGLCTEENFKSLQLTKSFRRRMSFP